MAFSARCCMGDLLFQSSICFVSWSMKSRPVLPYGTKKVFFLHSNNNNNNTNTNNNNNNNSNSNNNNNNNSNNNNNNFFKHKTLKDYQ